jgi:hypothetical protein
LLEANESELKLNQFGKAEDHLILFEQKNERASRKVLLPFIADLAGNDKFISLAIEGKSPKCS